MPSFRLDRLSAGEQIVSKDGRPSPALQLRIQRAWEKIEEAFDQQQETIDRIRRLNSHTEPTTILRATEDGSEVTIEVLDHTRVYADGTTLAITGSSYDGFAGNTGYACYYDDTTLRDETPQFQFTTDTKEAQAAKADGRHWCGSILTPALSSGDTIESGGAYPMSAASIGGELLP